MRNHPFSPDKGEFVISVIWGGGLRLNELMVNNKVNPKKSIIYRYRASLFIKVDLDRYLEFLYPLKTQSSGVQEINA